jgi:ribose/xylose/arabinose/galactoside ABC-type transport system permease subunit
MIPTARYHRRPGAWIATLILALAVLALVLGPSGPVEPPADAFGAMLQGAGVLVLLAAALAAALRSGLVDLSAGAVLGLGVAVIRLLESQHGLPLWQAALAAVAVALLAGALNAWLTARLGLASPIATLLTALLAGGLAAALAFRLAGEPAAMAGSLAAATALVGGTVGQLVPGGAGWPPPLDLLAIVPMQLLWALVLVLLLAWAAGAGRLGWHATAVGSDPTTAHRLGLPVGRIRAAALLLTGLTAGLAAVLVAAAPALTPPSPPLATLTGLEALAAAAAGSALAVGIGSAVLLGAMSALALAIGSAALAQHGLPVEVGPLVAGGGALLLLLLAGQARRSLLGGFA